MMPPATDTLVVYRIPISAWIAVFAISGILCSKADEDGDKFFQSKVQPLLEAKCLKCHSHVWGKMKGGLTLDSRSGWAEGGDSGPTIIPGKPGESRLITAVRYTDPDLQMPPKAKLSDDQIAVLVEWVKKGAPDPRKLETQQLADTDWWSLKKLVAPKPPRGGHPIDAFVQARLKAAGLKPAPQADRTSLIRRLSFDLHGLLPTPEEVAAFANDSDPNAYRNLADELLASPRYGERWARHWLDTIHFADSHGCEHDVKRPNAWRFRDYVIDRLNADVPWGRFIREQLATDVAYPEQPELTAALGFIAAGPQELSRAGTAPVTFDYLDRDDMVTQMMAAFASTTANCARCHTHKFDPITQEDYYALQAVFAGVGKGDIPYDTTAAIANRRRELQSLLAAGTARNAEILLPKKYTQIVRQWEESRRQETVNWEPLDAEVFVASGGAVLTKQADGSILASGTIADQENYTVTSKPSLGRLTAIRLDVLRDDRLPKNGPGRAGNGNLHLAEVAVTWFPKDSNTPVKLKIARASADFDQVNWVAAHAIDGDPKTGWAIFPRINESHHIVLELAKPIDLKPEGRLAVTLKQLYPPKHLIGRFKLSITDADGAVQALPTAATVGLKKPEDQRTKPEQTAIAAVALSAYATKGLASLPKKATVYGVSTLWSHAKKLSKPRTPTPVHLLRRGDIHSPEQEVGPGALSAIKALNGRFELADPKQESSRRLALADWLAHHDNPLTWRSIVNRVWHYHFGSGLSDTPNDFGRMGTKPSHPDLLDWLAVWFRDEAKGSLKELHRLILTSETWQQASLTEPNSKDSSNRLLGRMNRQRLDAEMLRDSVLRITGRLDLTMGGPGIEQFTTAKGPQATPILDYAAFDWNAPAAGRRSIYRVVWRGIPDPFMEAMDFPDLGLLAPKRGFSVSALQSLTLFNNQFMLQASEWFAQRVQKERNELDDQIARAVELAWLRAATEDELNEFTTFTRQHGLPAFCRLLLNSNEFLFVE
jgi:mono/diheme cytochrome c family protein